MARQATITPTRTDDPRLVLVVDDARPDRERIIRWLDAGGRYRVRSTASAAQARKAIVDDPPDCVVLDYMLGDESGLDLLSELQDDDQPVPVVMLTGVGHSAVAAEALRRGAEDCLTKGTVSADVVRHAVDSAIERAAARRLSAQRQSADMEARLAIQAAERRASYLADATRRLASAADVDTTLDRLARLAVPFIADRVLIDLVDDAGAHTNRTVVDAGDAPGPSIPEVPGTIGDNDPIARVLRSGAPDSHHATPGSRLDPAVVASVGATDGPAPQAVLIVPLRTAGTPIGTMTFVSFDPLRRYDTAEQLVAEEIALRGTLAIANAMGHASRQRALASAADSTRLLRVLAAISTTLSRPLEADEALPRVVEQSVPALGALTAVALTDDGGDLSVAAEHSASEAFLDEVDAAALAAARAEVRATAVRAQGTAERVVDHGPGAAVLAVPLTAARGVVGVYETVVVPAAAADDQLRTVAEDVARRVSSYIDRMRATQRHTATDAALRSSEQKLQLALGAAGAGVFEIHGDPMMITVDDAHAALWEVSGDERTLPLDDALAHVAPDDRARLRERLTVAFAGGQPFELEYRLSTTAGARWLMSRGQQLDLQPADTDGLRLVGVTFDITQRRRMTERIAREGERAQRLQHATAALSGAVDRSGVIAAVHDVVATAAGSVDAFVVLAHGDMVAAPPTVEPLSPALADAVGTVLQQGPVDAPSAVPLVVVDGDAGPRWHAVLPLHAAGAAVGAIVFVFDTPVDLDEDARLFVLALTRHVATALDRALLFDRERQVAESLQRQLLPRSLPSRDDAVFAARYLPASADIKVGGDWYDAVELDDGSVLFTVGDVMGHGVASASAMGQLRVGLRALATIDPSPAAVLTAADRLAEDLLADRYATACVGRILPTTAAAEPGPATQARSSAAAEGVTRVVRLASAGHQPVLQVGADGTSRWLEVDTSVPVGVARQLGLDDRVREHTFQAEAGSTILLFTDGLVERHGEDLDAGHTRLRAAASRIFAGGTDDPPLPARCDALIDAVVEDDPRDDDIALMAIRLR